MKKTLPTKALRLSILAIIFATALTLQKAAGTPVISAITNIVTQENVNTGWIPFQVFDSVTGGVLDNVGATSSNQQLLPDLNIETGGMGTNWMFRLRPTHDAIGTATVTIYATNDLDEVGTQSFLLTVQAVNTPPSIEVIPDITIPEDISSQWLQYRVSDLESDAVLLQVSARSSDQNLMPDTNITVIRAGIGGLIRLVPVADAFGEATITVTVTDPQGATNATSFHLTVTSVNDPPTLDPLTDVVMTQNQGTQTIPLTGISGGPTNESQAVTLSAYATPFGILRNLQVAYSGGSTGSLSFDPENDATGTALVTVVVDDGDATANTFSRSFIVQVNPANQPPTISVIPDQVTDLNQPKTISFNVSDLETAAGDLSLVAYSSNPSLVPNGNVWFGGSDSSRSALIIPSGSGSALITIVATDGGLASASNSFAFTVRPSPSSPVISPQPQDQTASLGGSVTFAAGATGDAPLLFQWQRNGSDLSNQTNATLTLNNLAAGDAGAYTVVVSNGSDSATSLAAQLRVLAQPTFNRMLRSGGTNHIRFSTVTGLTYTVEYKNLYGDAWKPLGATNGTGDVVEMVDPGAKMESRFYRVKAQ